MDVTKIKDIKQYLISHPDCAIDIAQDISHYNGELAKFDLYTMDDLVDCWGTDAASVRKLLTMFADAVKNKSYNDDSVFYFDDVYGLTMTTMDDVREDIPAYADEIIDNLIDLYPGSIDIYNEEFEQLFKTMIESEEV